MEKDLRKTIESVIELNSDKEDFNYFNILVETKNKEIKKVNDYVFKLLKDEGFNVYIVDPNDSAIDSCSMQIGTLLFSIRHLSPNAEEFEKLNKEKTVMFIQNIDQITDLTYRRLLLDFSRTHCLYNKMTDQEDVFMPKFLFTIATLSKMDEKDYRILTCMDAKDTFIKTEVDLIEMNCFAPVYDGKAKALILGTVPSNKATGFYYTSSVNKFYYYLSKSLNYDFDKIVNNCKKTNNYKDIKDALCKYNIALYDTINKAQSKGSQDADIQEQKLNTANEMINILEKNPEIKIIYVNSIAAEKNLKKIFGGKRKLITELRRIMNLSDKEIPYQRILSPSPNVKRSGKTDDDVIKDWKAKFKGHLIP